MSSWELETREWWKDVLLEFVGKLVRTVALASSANGRADMLACGRGWSYDRDLFQRAIPFPLDRSSVLLLMADSYRVFASWTVRPVLAPVYEWPDNEFEVNAKVAIAPWGVVRMDWPEYEGLTHYYA
jgi:hypothetical protein